MFYLLSRYLAEAFRYHLRDIVSFELLVGLGLATAVYFSGTGALLRALGPERMAPLLMAYASLAFGACLTSTTIAIRLADSEFADFLHEQGQQRLPSFDSVVFRISWTGTVHWIMLLSSLLITLFSQARAIEGPFVVAFLVGLFGYGISLLFTALLTISYLGMARWQWLEDRHARGRPRRGGGD